MVTKVELGPGACCECPRDMGMVPPKHSQSYNNHTKGFTDTPPLNMGLRTHRILTRVRLVGPVRARSVPSKTQDFKGFELDFTRSWPDSIEAR